MLRPPASDFLAPIVSIAEPAGHGHGVRVDASAEPCSLAMAQATSSHLGKLSVAHPCLQADKTYSDSRASCICSEEVAYISGWLLSPASSCASAA